MKTKTHFLVMLLIVLSLAVNATDKKDTQKGTTLEVVRQGNVFKLFYLKKDVEKVNVKIIDKLGRLIFTERIKNEEGFVRPYNFKGLDHGDYKIIVSGKGRDMATTVHYGNLESTESVASLQLVKCDEMKNMNRVFKLTIVNQGETTAYIKVKNEKEEAIFSITESFSGNYGKLFNLNQLKEDTTLEVTMRGETTVFTL